MALGQHPSGAPGVPSFDDRLNDVGGVSTFLLEPTGPDNSIGSCNSPWYVHGPGGISNTGSGFALRTLPPFCSAI